MALIFPSSSSTLMTSSHKCYHLTTTAIKASSSSPDSTESIEEIALPAKSASPPVGFGSSSSISTSSPVKKPKSNNKKERARIIRRDPVQTPKFASIKQKEQLGDNVSTEQGSNERAFLLAWLGLGSLIIAEGLALAASGILYYISILQILIICS